MNQQLMQMLSQLLRQSTGLSGLVQRKRQPYQLVSASNPSGYTYSMHQLLHQKLSQMGPLGGIASRLLLGDAFDANGNPTNLNAMLTPMGGSTYAQAYRQFARNSLAYASAAQTRRASQDLSKQFYMQYYKTITPGGTDAGAKAFAQNVASNPLQLAGGLRYFADPMQIEQTKVAINRANTAIQTRGYIRNQFDFNGVRERTKSATESIKQLAINAARRNMGDTSNGDFGGMSAGAVGTLAGLMAESRDYFGSATGTQLQTRVKSFKSKVQEMSNALRSLRDVFGNDVQGMVKIVQEMTGSKIGYLDPNTVKNVGTRITDALNYRPDLNTGEIRNLGLAAGTYLRARGVSGTVAMSAGVKGTDMAFLMSPGMSSYGMTTGQYNAMVTTSVAQAHGSANNRNMSLAYAIALEDGKVSSLQQFISKVEQGGGTVDAAMSIAGVSSVQDLDRGYGLKGYRQAMSSQMSTKFSVRANFDQSMMGSRLMLSSKYGDDRTAKALQALDKADLVTQKAFWQSGNVDAFDKQTQQVLRYMSERSPEQTKAYGLMRVRQMQAQRFRQGQAQIRSAFGGIDMQGGNLYYQTAKALTAGRDANGNYTVGNKAIKADLVQVWGLSRLGFNDLKDAKRFVKSFDASSGARLMQAAAQGKLGEEHTRIIRQYETLMKERKQLDQNSELSPEQKAEKLNQNAKAMDRVTEDMELVTMHGDSVAPILKDYNTQDKKSEKWKQANMYRNKMLADKKAYQSKERHIRETYKNDPVKMQAELQDLKNASKLNTLHTTRAIQLGYAQNKSAKIKQLTGIGTEQTNGFSGGERQARVWQLLQSNLTTKYEDLADSDKQRFTKQQWDTAVGTYSKSASGGGFRTTTLQQLIRPIMQNVQKIADFFKQLPATKTQG